MDSWSKGQALDFLTVSALLLTSALLVLILFVGIK